MNVVFFLLGESPAAEFYVPTFRNTCSIFIGSVSTLHPHLTPPMKMEQAECSETSAHKIQTPGIHQKVGVQLLFVCLREVLKFYTRRRQPTAAEIHHRLQQQCGEECLLRRHSSPYCCWSLW